MADQDSQLLIKSPDVPDDAKIIILILKSMGVERYEQRVVHQLLDFVHRYAMKALKGAKVYSNHAKKSKIDIDDLRMAIKAILTNSFIPTPPREVLVNEALRFNSQPIMPIPAYPEVLLPEPRFCLAPVSGHVSTSSDQQHQLSDDP